MPVKRDKKFSNRFGLWSILNSLDRSVRFHRQMLQMSANSNEEDIFDKWSKRVLNMAIAQRIPTPILSLMDLESIAPKRKQQVKANMQKYISKTFPSEKLMCLDTNGDALNHLRFA